MQRTRWPRLAGLLAVSIMLLTLLAGSVGAADDTALQTRHGTRRIAGGQVHQPDDTQRARWAAMDVAGIHGSERGLQVVIGADSREEITDTTVFPYRAIAQIEGYDTNLEPGYITICTATFIGPDVLLTAAHCVYSPESYGGWVDDVRVIPGRNGSDEPFGAVWVSELWVPNGYIQDSSVVNPYDYALLTLGSSDLGNSVGQMQIGVLTDTALLASDFNPTTSGYPGEMPFGTQWESSEPTLSGLDAEYLEHEIDSTQGQSGSAVWRGSDQAIVGVESFEIYGSYELNVAVRINENVLNDLLSACGTLGCTFGYFSEGDPSPPTPTPSPSPTPTPDPNNPPVDPRGDVSAFERTWARTDLPVRDGAVSRTWMWGPTAATGYVNEPYAEAPGGYRTVLYHEKSRMEITAPDADANALWYVSNGLLSKELVTGALQLGNERFEQHEPAQINVAGDPDDSNGPTYATFGTLLHAVPTTEGAVVTATVDRAGQIGNDPATASHAVTAAYFVPETNHSVASVFWSFMNSLGPVYENGAFGNAALFPNPFYATGFPITEPYWATVRVGGVQQLVLIQVFERRVLTYTPGNPPGWEIEAGNVGLHYHTWRYELIDGDSPTPPPSGDVPATGDVIAAYDLTQELDTGQVALGVHASIDGDSYNLRMESENTYLVYVDDGLADVSVAVDVRLVTAGAATAACVMSRLDLGAVIKNYELCMTESGQVFAAYYASDGAYTLLLDQTGAYDPGAWNALEIRARGAQFWFLVNGDLAGSASHSGSASGSAGFEMYNLEAGIAEWGFRSLVLRDLQ